MHAGDDRVRAYRRKELIAYADGDVEAFILMTGLADEVDTDEIDAAIAAAVKGLRACGYSWPGSAPSSASPAGRSATLG